MLGIAFRQSLEKSADNSKCFFHSYFYSLISQQYWILIYDSVSFNSNTFYCDIASDGKMSSTVELETQTFLPDSNMDFTSSDYVVTEWPNITTTRAADVVVMLILPLEFVDYFELTCLVIMGFLGAMGNGLVVLVQVRSTDIISTDLLVATMAAFDFFDSTINTSLTFCNTGFREFVLSTTYCQLLNLFVNWTAISSAMFIGAIAVDRYFLTCRPLSTCYNMRVTSGICVLIPTLAIALSVPPALALHIHPFVYYCYFTEIGKEILNIWNKVVVIIVFSIFIITSIGYFKIALLIRNRVNSKKGDMRRSTISGETATTVIATSSSVSNENDGNVNAEKLKRSDTSSINTTVTPDRIILTEQHVTNDNAEQENVKVLVFFDDSVNKKQRKRKQRQRKSETTSADQRHKEAAMNRITMVLFTISLIYVIAWSTSATLLLTNFNIDPTAGRLLYLFRRVCIVTNPALFIFMSSKFKDGARKMLTSMRRK